MEVETFDEQVEEIIRGNEEARGIIESDEEKMRRTIEALEEKGMVNVDRETGVAIVDNSVLQAAYECLEGSKEDDGIVEVDDKALGLTMQPSGFNWRRVDRNRLESMEKILMAMHSPILQIMTPTALNPIVPALKPIAHAQRAYDQWQRQEAKAQAEEESREAAKLAQEQQLIEQQQNSEIWMNDWGFYDGRNFYLRCFAASPEKGTCGTIDFAQSMGKMMLRYTLTSAHLDLSQEDGGLVVELSSWQLQVSILDNGRLTKIEAMSGELFEDIRRNRSWWTFEENPEDPSVVTLLIVMIKEKHKTWETIWSNTPLNPRRKKRFQWNPNAKLLDESAKEKEKQKEEQSKLGRLPQGSPQDRGVDEPIDEVTPEEIATGVEENQEDLDHITVLVHLDAEVLEQVTSQIPLEDCFAVDVGPSSLEVYVRTTNRDSRICSGELVGHVIPQYSTWQFVPSVRRCLPADSEIKAPAYWNPALRIRLVKDLPRGFFWGAVFKPDRLSVAKLRLPRERSLKPEAKPNMLEAAPPVVAPVTKPSLETSPVKASKGTRGKSQEFTDEEVSKRMCKRIVCNQDDEKSYIFVHLDSSIDKAASETKTKLEDFFGVSIEEEYVEVFLKSAGKNHTVCEGYLGGRCVIEESSWSFTHLKRKAKDKGKGKGKSKGGEKGDGKGKIDKGILALKISLVKAFDKVTWRTVFDRQDEQGVDKHEDTTTLDGVPFLD